MEENRSPLADKSLHTLEYPRVLEMLAAEAACEDTRDRIAELRPEADIERCRLLQTECADAKALIAGRGSAPISGVRDVRGALMRADKGSPLSLRELLDIAQLLRVTRALKSYIDGGEERKTVLDGLFYALSPNKTLEERLVNSIVSPEELADGASTELASIRRQIRSAEARVRELLNKIIHSTSHQKHLQEAIVTMRGDRFVIPVKSEYRQELPGLVHDTSSSGATLFVEPVSVVEANNEIRLLRGKEQREIERIIAELSAEAAAYMEPISQNYSLILELDFIFSRAKLAWKMDADQPELNEDGIIDLKRARHPLIDPKKVMPTDIRLGGDFDTLVITGPNTGGKTVVLKTIGLLTLMAMSGLQIPVADGSRLSVFEYVLADIGDEQSIEQSLSTFSSHMRNIVGMLEVLNNRSLVLFDELGAGTDPVEGAALAVSILERVRRLGARVAATTHYAELKVYAMQTAGVENASCEFDVETLRPTYRLLTGIPGKSNAFAISRRLGLSEELVDRARELIREENVRFEDILTELERNRQKMEQARETAERYRRETKQLMEDAASEKKRLDAMREKELERARTDARRIVGEARETMNVLVEEMTELKKQKDSADFAGRIAQARASAFGLLRQLEDKIDPVRELREEYVPPLPRELRAGDTVLIRDIDKKAVVISPPDNSGNVQVQAGIIRTRVKLSNLRLLEEEKVQKPAAVYQSREGSLGGGSAKMELDLRGMNGDEAALEIDNFMDSAVMSGLTTVTLIHGKGTGALRASVHEHLRRHPQVAGFRLGRYGEGENGVTIVELGS